MISRIFSVLLRTWETDKDAFLGIVCLAAILPLALLFGEVLK